MPAKSSRWSGGFGGPLKSLAVGLTIFLLGSWMAHWLTLRNAHGWPVFLDHALAGLAAGMLVLLYERERQGALETLHESQEQFRLLANAAPALIWMANTDKLCDYFNKTWLDFTGRSMDAELGNGWAEGVHAEDLQGCIDTYTQSFERREKFNMEYRLLRHDGEYRWILDVGVPRFHEDGSFAGYIGIGIDVTERKNAEKTLEQAYRALEEQTASLQIRRELLQSFIKHVPAAVAMFDREMRYVRVSDRWCSDYSLDNANILGRSHYEVFPDISDAWKEIHRRCLAGETMRAEEERWERPDGTTWLRWEIRPWQIRDGKQGGILIFAEDITERKRWEETLLGMSRKLVEAHEQERTRIGRELHDDVVQRLALLALELEQTARGVPESASEVRARIDQLRNETTQISDDVQSLSHELHSSKLEYLGLDGAARNFCRELGDRQKAIVDFQSHDLPEELPADVSVSLLRVLQEALRNATKHSGVNRFEVRLWGNPGEIHLTVGDLGKGFEMEAAMKSSGLGLTSMQERLRFLGGELSIRTKPNDGTTVHARVRLSVR